jgi:hypothetical protein
VRVAKDRRRESRRARKGAVRCRVELVDEVDFVDGVDEEDDWLFADGRSQ